ncbi:hypothetical protein [Chitinophaga sp. Cy-1792]|uniref:hypothetical protein n=1 Tax=Chitinophaga sp. Cy-1792 TaxID=2608339 RepID=UPI00142012E7|nr:hypothetical protein [Chitinophaga sp. Cy-1792]NIG55486.1 hypothetical protein [Chitinophaga sp. Cy-1792]
MKILLTGLLLSVSLFANAQDYKEPSKESQEYGVYRSKVTIPPYGLPKVKAMVSGLELEGDNDYNETAALTAKAWNALSFREKFTYCMIHGENFSQNCDASPPVQDEQKKVFGQLPSAFGEFSWSDRQLKFFNDNQDSVLALIRESVNRSKRVGVNYKEAIVAMNAVEMIPFLEEVYLKDKKDHDILTIFLLLMKENKYAPFLSSVSYKKLYGNDSDYGTYIDFNSANEALILQRVNDFYKNYKK